VIGRRQMQFIFCDDMRRELGSKVSFMGVYGPAVEVTEGRSHGVTVVSMFQAHYGDDISDVKVAVGVSKDGEAEKRHALHGMPTDALNDDKKPESVRALEKLVPDHEIPAILVGTTRFDGLDYKQFCEIKGYYNGKVIARTVFYRKPSSASKGKSPKSPPKADRTSPKVKSRAK